MKQTDESRKRRRQWKSAALLFSMTLLVLERTRTGDDLKPSTNNRMLTKTTIDPAFFDCGKAGSMARCFSLRDFLVQGNFAETYETRLGGNNPNLPALVGSENLSYAHLHKCGGTSIKSTMFRRSKTKIKSYKHSYGGGSKFRKEQNDQVRALYIESIGKAQRKGEIFPVFTVVRDPVDRFISAVQQVMHYNDDLRGSCLKESARETIKCAIEDVDRRNYRNDVHLQPMVAHFRLLENIPHISIFSMNDIPLVLQALGGKADAHAHDRSSESYATSTVLSTMSVKDCDSKMIETICHLYAIDVAMMHHLGFATPNCEQPTAGK